MLERKPFLAALLILLTTLPTAFSLNADGAAPDASHRMAQSLRDFASYTATNLQVRPDGAVELRRLDGALQAELNICSARDYQTMPDIAVDSKNNYVAVWQDDRGASTAIYAQKLDINGNLLGPEIQVASKTNDQMYPAVEFDSKDNFIITWYSYSYTSSQVYAQKFDTNGNKVGGEVFVSNSGDCRYPCIALNSRDEWIISWVDQKGGYSQADLYAQRLDSNGGKLGGQIVISSDRGSQMSPAITVNSKDEFLIAYDDDRDSSYSDIYAQRFDPNGTKLGGTTQVSSGGRDEYSAAVAVNSSDCYVVAWTDTRSSSSDYDIYAQRLDASGNRAGGEMSIISKTGLQSSPDIIFDASDNFVVAYQDSPVTYSGNYNISARRFDTYGNLQGGDILLLSGTNRCYAPAIAPDTGEGFMVVWYDYRTSTTTPDIYGRRYLRTVAPWGEMIFPDLAPTKLWRWSNITANVTIANPLANTLSFEFSTDGGVSWVTVPGNGSLGAAGSCPVLRLVARLSSNDNLTTPVLRNITVNYIVNTAPRVAAIADVQVWRNARVNLTANATDADSDPLSYSWCVLDPSAEVLNGTVSQTLSLKATRSGKCRILVTASDGLGSGIPATVNLTVMNRVPSLSITMPKLTVTKGNAVTLAATSTDQDGDNVAVTWSQTAGKHVYIDNWTYPEATFVASHPGTYSFRAVASDGEVLSTPATVDLLVKEVPAPSPLTEPGIIASLLILVAVIAAVAVYLGDRKLKKAPAPAPVVKAEEKPQPGPAGGPPVMPLQSERPVARPAERYPATPAARPPAPAPVQVTTQREQPAYAAPAPPAARPYGQPPYAAPPAAQPVAGQAPEEYPPYPYYQQEPQYDEYYPPAEGYDPYYQEQGYDPYYQQPYDQQQYDYNYPEQSNYSQPPQQTRPPTPQPQTPQQPVVEQRPPAPQGTRLFTGDIPDERAPPPPEYAPRFYDGPLPRQEQYPGHPPQTDPRTRRKGA